MKKMNNQLSDMGLKTTIKRKLREEFDKAKRDPYFTKLIETLNVSDEVLMKYTSQLQDSAIEYKNSLETNSILECKNKIKGYAYLPIKNGNDIEFAYIECDYKKEFDKKNNFLNNISIFDMPREIKEARMEEIFSKNSDRDSAIGWIIKFIKNYNPNEKQKGLYLHGNFGSGKTYLLAAMFNELAKNNIKSTIIYWPEFLRDLKSSFYKGGEFERKFNAVKKSPLLLIDDIGAENTTEWGRDEVLGPIMQYRMQEGLPTFFTSNLDIEALEEHFAATKEKVSSVKATRIIERIKQLTDNIEMVSQNLRK